MTAKELIVVLSIILPYPAYALGLHDAVSWILSKQNHDGSWGSQSKGIEYQVHITSRVLIALSDYLKSISENASQEELLIEESMERGRRWLDIHAPVETLGLSAKTIALGTDSMYSDLKNHQNRDGGWGRGAGFQSTQWYTAKALLALSPYVHEKDIKAGAEFLLNTHDEDGSWENTATVTSAAILALARIYSVYPDPKYIDAAREGEEWLLKKQDEDGGWFDSSSTAETILALKAMYSYFREPKELSSIDRAIIFLLKMQREDGSWGASSSSRIFDDVYTTSLVISSLSEELPYKALDPKVQVSARPSLMHALGGDGLEIAVVATNEGVLEVKDLEIIVSVPKAIGGEVINWRVGSLEIGENITKHLNISIPPKSVGRHILKVEVLYTHANEVNRRYHDKSVEATILVHDIPFELELLPSQVENGTRYNFTAILVGRENTALHVENISVDLETEWGNVSLPGKPMPLIKTADDVTVRVFEATSPKRPGVYIVPLMVFVNHPSLGGRWFSFYEEVIVSHQDSHLTVPMNLTVPMIPTRMFNLIGIVIILSTSVLILNLLIGFDIVK